MDLIFGKRDRSSSEVWSRFFAYILISFISALIVMLAWNCVSMSIFHIDFHINYWESLSLVLLKNIAISGLFGQRHIQITHKSE